MLVLIYKFDDKNSCGGENAATSGDRACRGYEYPRLPFDLAQTAIAWMEE
jgi:hypothetical protein